MNKTILTLLLFVVSLSYSQNYIEWNDKKEEFDIVRYMGGDEHSAFPKLLAVGHKLGSVKAKKFDSMRISGFSELGKGEEITFCSTEGILTRRPKNINEKCLIHVGMVDKENDYHYYQAKTATLKGLGNNKYELIADFRDVDAAGNNYTNDPNYPNYTIKVVFEYKSN